MKRPSRRLRESVATILKNGRFLAPPRAKRITTIMWFQKVFEHGKDDDYSRNTGQTASSIPGKCRVHLEQPTWLFPLPRCFSDSAPQNLLCGASLCDYTRRSFFTTLRTS